MKEISEAQIYASHLAHAKKMLVWSRDRADAISRRLKNSGLLLGNNAAYDCEYVRDALDKSLDELETSLNDALETLHNSLTQGVLFNE